MYCVIHKFVVYDDKEEWIVEIVWTKTSDD